VKIRNKITAAKAIIQRDGYMQRDTKVRLQSILKDALLGIDEYLQLKMVYDNEGRNRPQ